MRVQEEGAVDPEEKRWRGPEKRFKAKAQLDEETGCVLWTGSTVRGGYGQIWASGTSIRVHRYAWARVHGWPPRSMDVEHRCRNRLCVNVEHLRLATRAENLQNLGSLSTGSSKYRGVSYYPKLKRWRAYGHLNGRFKSLGTHATEEEAARIAKEWRAENMPFSEEDD